MTILANNNHIFFSQDELDVLDHNRIPHHVAIIPDGNRRWAKQNQFSTEEGHKEGADILMDAVKAAKQLGIQMVTFFTFSTENWNRSADEVSAFMFLIASYLTNQKDEMVRSGIRLHTIGDISRLPKELIEIVDQTKAATSHCDQIHLVLALNYGGRDDIRRAIHSILDDYQNQRLKKEEITEQLISEHLDTGEWPDPDLLIRASGELRISNFFLWQLSYSEIYVTPVLWPDFTPHHLLEAVKSYQKRERRLGGA